MNEQEEILKNGLIGELNEETPYVIYCNEQEYKGGLLFKCCDGCKHNPIKE